MTERSSTPVHSTGRGGAGNIGEDPSLYTDGSITREGPIGESSRGEYSAGRGGAGNMIESPRDGTPVPKSEEYVPETAMRSGEGHENYHTGRGGQGNVHKDKYGGHSGPQKGEGDERKEGLMEKVKHALGGEKK
ncbi:hypothetical protein LTR27_004559 [Elasticomyces elasticus]|nr:hypothetical protein LTR27_004559 [Elasticomyces elasticus]